MRGSRISCTRNNFLIFLVLMFACCSNLSSSSISRKEMGNEKVFFIKIVTSSTVARHIVSSAHSLAQTTDVSDRAGHVSSTDRFSLPQVA